MPSPVKMDKLLKDQNISFESWKYNEEIVKKINAFEFKCYRRLMGISWRDRRTNESVKEQVEDLAGVQKPPIQIAQERKMNYSAMSRDIPVSLDWLTPSCMEEFLEREGGVSHGDVG